MILADRKRIFIDRVRQLTEARTREMDRRHTSCVSVDTGPRAVAELFRADRVPATEPEIEKLAAAIVDWLLPLDRDAATTPQPYRDDDLETC